MGYAQWMRDPLTEAFKTQAPRKRDRRSNGLLEKIQKLDTKRGNTIADRTCKIMLIIACKVLNCKHPAQELYNLCRVLYTLFRDGCWLQVATAAINPRMV